MTTPSRRPAPLPRLLAAACAAALLGGCAIFRTPTVPMPVTIEKSACNAPVKTLIVFLPGAFSLPQEFIDEGYVAEVRKRRIAADMMLADAHIGYYRNRSVVDRLSADVMARARAAGYDQIWVVGISLGGFGTLLQAQTAPDAAVAGLVAISPYLGEKEAISAVQAGGGLNSWQAPAAVPAALAAPTAPASTPASAAQADFSTELWRWLQGYSTSQPAPGRPPLYLAWASEDDRGPALGMLSAVLPKDRVFTTAGGHDWPEWRRLWVQILDKLPLPTCAPAG